MKNKLRFISATLALAMSMLAFSACNPLSFLSGNDTSKDSASSSQQNKLPPPTTASGLINSLDKLNYYAARKNHRRPPRQ